MWRGAKVNNENESEVISLSTSKFVNFREISVIDTIPVFVFTVTVLQTGDFCQQFELGIMRGITKMGPNHVAGVSKLLLRPLSFRSIRLLSYRQEYAMRWIYWIDAA